MPEKNLEKVVKVPEFDREKFRQNFHGIYENVVLEDYKELYTRLYGFYENLTSLITIEPAPINPSDIKKFTDEDVCYLETIIASMYGIGLNYVGATLDNSAGRQFIPRDPTKGDGSWVDSYNRFNKK